MDNLLIELLKAVATPGNEHDVRDIMNRELEKFGKITLNPLTDIICERNGNTGDRKKIVIGCHMDSPGFTVKRINEDGTLNFITLGGIQGQNAHLRTVMMKCSSEYIMGVITVDGKIDDRNPEYTGFFGFTSKEDALEKGVKLGDIAGWNSEVTKLGEHICGPNIDNRIGAYLTIKMAQLLDKKDLDVDVYYLGTSCEETGQRGAEVLSKMIKPDLAILFDATYAIDDVEMGEGPCLTLYDNSIFFPMNIRDWFINVAEENGLKYQFEVYNYAGTDARYFSVAGHGCITFPLLIPTLNNHTSLEIMHEKDIDATLKMTSAMIERIKTIL